MRAEEVVIVVEIRRVALFSSAFAAFAAIIAR
jgi:hypothetical protein